MESILGMSVKKIQALVDLFTASDKEKDVGAALLVRMAYHADGKNFKEYLETISKD